MTINEKKSYAYFNADNVIDHFYLLPLVWESLSWLLPFRYFPRISL